MAGASWLLVMSKKLEIKEYFAIIPSTNENGENVRKKVNVAGNNCRFQETTRLQDQSRHATTVKRIGENSVGLSSGYALLAPGKWSFCKAGQAA